MAPSQNLAVLGTSLFAPEVADLAGDTGRYVVAAFVENLDREKTRQPFLGRPVVWIDDAGTLAETHVAVCALGTTRRHRFVDQAYASGLSFCRVLHPSAHISSTSSVGEGTIVSVGVIVGSHASLGRHVIVNRGALIGHHTTIGDFVTVCPGANIAGAVTIGACAYIGIGAIILDRITIGAHAVIGAGAIVTRDVPERVQVMGIPARVTRTNIEGR